MAGRGPAPKDPERRARSNADPVSSRALRLVREAAPSLPPLGEGVEWHPRTVEWWATWCRSELARDFTATDWSFLIDTALMHHAMWSRGQWTLAAEVRLRVAKFGATPEDRARLRITFADAEQAEDKQQERRGATPARERYRSPAASA
jgi:ribosomal protein L31E